MKRTYLTFLVLALCSGAAIAQLPPGVTYAVASMQFTSGGDNEVALVDAKGSITTVVKLGVGVIHPGSICNAVRNDAFLVFDSGGIHRIDYATLGRSYTTLKGGAGSIRWGCVDENGGVAWVTSTGDLYRADDEAGTNTTLINSGGPGYNTMAWEGSSGVYFVGPYTSSSTVVSRFIARDGTVVRSIPFISSITGADWTPWNGDLLVSRYGSQDWVIRVDQLGAITSLGQGVTAIASTNSVEVAEQPNESFFCTEIGADPKGIYMMIPGGAVQTLSLTNLNLFRPADGCFAQDRAVWGLDTWRVGRTGNLNINFGWPQAGDYYQVALSFSHTPGVSLGNIGELHLTPDPIFYLSVAGVPGLFSNFAGRLSRSGTARASVTVPGISALQGTRMFAGAITYDTTGITQVSNCWGTTIQP